MNIKIQRNSDPFKKYWWVLLVVFGGLAAGVCLPAMGEADGSSGGSDLAAGGEDGLRSVGGGASSLDPTQNPNGAPGGVIDLSMDGAGGKRRDGGLSTSSLYTAPEDASAAAGAATGAVASAGGAGKGRLADALRDISKRHHPAADPSGWGGQKAQRGFSASFSAPKANFGGLSGLGGGSSASGARFNAEPAGFISGSASTDGGGRVGITSTRGLRDDGSDDKTQVASFNALRNVSRSMNRAVNSGDIGSALAAAGRSFDGGGAGGMTIGRGGAAEGAVAAGLTAAPKNLKANDPKLTDFKFQPPPKADEPQIDEKEQRMRMQNMIMQGLLMGIMSMALGPAAGMIMGPMMMMMQAQNAQTQQTSSANAAATQARF